MHEVNRHKLHRAEPSIYPSNELVNGGSQVLVLFHVLPGWHSQLNEDNLGENKVNCGVIYWGRVTNLANPFRMLCEEEFESVQLLWNTLDVIETVDTNDDFHATETLLELGDTVDDGLSFEILD